MIVVAGAVIGTAIGVAAAVAVGEYGRWQHPNDASAGSGAIIVMLTAPLGLCLGVIGAAVLISRREKRAPRRGFEVTSKTEGKGAR